MAEQSVDIEKEQSPWTFNQIKLLITKRFKYEAEFNSGKRKKTSLWTLVLAEIRNVDEEFYFSREDIHRKFNNLLITYKRIKRRNRETGRGSTKWEFYEMFDEMYGSKHFINPPKDIQGSSLDSVEPEMSEEDEVPSAPSKNSPKRKPQRSTSDVLEFLKTQEEAEDRRHQEHLKLDSDKMKLLINIKELLERILEQ